MSWEDREMEWPQYVLDRSLELAHRLAEDPHIGFGTGLIAQPEGDHLVLVGQGGQWLLSQDDLRPPFVSKGSLEVYSRDLLSAPLRTLEDVLRQCYDRFVWDPCGQTSPDPDCKEAPLKADQQKEADKYPDKHAKTSSYISFYPVYPHLYIYIDTYIYIHLLALWPIYFRECSTLEAPEDVGATLWALQRWRETGAIFLSWLHVYITYSP